MTMRNLHKSIITTIGCTPLVQVQKIITSKARILAKLEYFNPLSSVKDRVGWAMIEDAESKSQINKNTRIVEPTSGNTGIALAFVCGVLGYKLTLTMPESMSEERRKLLKALGAELILTPADEGMSGAIAKAEEMARNDKNVFIPQQFNNPSNPDIHRRTTGPEIWHATDGEVDFLVSGVGTGGTITGAAEALKQHKPTLKAIAVEPVNSPVITQALAGQKLTPGHHGLMGIGAGFIPKVLNLSILDEVITITDEEAYHYSREAAKHEGIFCGISSGAALCAADKLAHRPENAGKTIVVIIPSCGERYLSTPLYS
jgi:cysteine synthase A